MGEPITWRNVSGPSLADAARPLAYAQTAVNGGFDALKEAVKGYEAGQEKIWKQQDSDATQALLAKMYGAKTIEDFNNLRASGVLDATTGANGARIDRALINPILDARTGVMQERGTKEIAYNNAQREAKDAPLMANARQLMLNGDYAGAAAAVANTSPETQALFAKEKDARMRDLVVRSQTDAKAAADLEHLRNMDKAQADQARAALIQAGASASSAKSHAQIAGLQANEALEKRLSSLVSTRSGLTTTVSSSEGMKTVYDELAKLIKDPKELEKASRTAGQLASNSEFANATPSAVVNAVVGSQDTGPWYRPWSNTGDTAAANLRKIQENFNSNDAATARETALGTLNQQIEMLKRELKYPTAPAAVTPPPVAPGATPAPATSPTAALNLPAPTYKPLPGAPADLVDRAIQAANERQNADKAARASTAATDAANAKKAQEIKWLTTNEISVMSPSEAAKYLSQYGQVLEGGPNGRLAKALRQRM